MKRAIPFILFAVLVFAVPCLAWPPQHKHSQQQNQTQQQDQTQALNGSGNSTVTVAPTTTSTASSTSSASATSTASGNGDSNGNGANNTSISYTNPRQTATALAPAQFPTANCFKTYGGATQEAAFGLSIGAGRIDRDCSARELARSFVGINNFTAAAKVLCSTADAKRAKLTQADCEAIQTPVVAQTAPEPAQQPYIITNPTPSVVVNVPPIVVPAAQVIAAAPAAPVVPVKKAKKINPCPATGTK